MIYPSIRIEGSILSPDIIDRLEDLAGQKPTDFGFDSGTRVKDEIARAWADAQDYWRIFQRKLDSLKAETAATTETRNLWIVPLLGLLKYDLEYQKSGAELNGKTYAISHRAINRAHTPVHIVGYRDPAGLDRKPLNATLRMSAHAVVQEYLNLSEQLYGIVTNGRVIRLLRNSSRLIKQSYVEFDLDRIFTDGLFADFAVLFRLLHATRFAVTVETAAESPIERLHQDSLDSGTRIREGLSKAVEDAILTFANGFLAHPENSHLRRRLLNGAISADDYYKSLLRLIYRLLFLMVIEERGLVFPPQTHQRQRDTYDGYYSVHRLRKLSEKRYLSDKRQSDLWLALRSTFRLFQADGPGIKLGLKPLAGDLFRLDAIGELESAHLANDALLACLRSLSLYQHPENKQVIRVNYAALNVEELGSVYEGLLKYNPFVDNSSTVLQFTLRPGDDDTQSHYTPDDLVQPLIKHSLDHLITECLKGPDSEASLLDLRVADIACGSGHILLAAARRIATELAVVRTGEEQPSPTAYRTALRDVIRTCIYGVDLNPLAVELCKVALWLEAHNPGEPLNFLDHHIKCGNAIVGFVRREEVDVGVPDEAFAKLPGDDAEIGKAIRARNKRERGDRKQGTFAFTSERQGEIAAVLDRWKSTTAMPEGTPTEIEAKKQAFEIFTSSGSAWALKQIASIPIAQFYLPRIDQNESRIITDAEFRDYWAGNLVPQSDATSTAFEIAQSKRFFHWFLEFPEIGQRGGFDCILGNPPYLGAQKMSEIYGREQFNTLSWAYNAGGLADLITYFLRRAYALIREKGFVALLGTSTLAKGDSREVGLKIVTEYGGVINFAIRKRPWPGRAAAHVCMLALSRGDRGIVPILDGAEAVRISSYLEDDPIGEAVLHPLPENAGRAFIGSNFNGDGFIVDEAFATDCFKDDPCYHQVLFRNLLGIDVNSRPEITANRWIICFHDWSLERARAFPRCLEHLQKTVRLQRSKHTNPTLRERWWQYERLRKPLYEAVRRQRRVLVRSQAGKHGAFALVETDLIYDQKVVVFALESYADFATLNSTLHELFVWRFGGELGGTTPNYSPERAFLPFPRPQNNHDLSRIGETYYDHRRMLMLSLWLGLTDVYNLFHSRELEADLKKYYASRAKKDPQGLTISDEHRAGALAFTFEQALTGIVELRRLHVELDNAVRDAYGWPDLDLRHDFYEIETLPENDRIRYTISPTARKELLARLLKENHIRAALQTQLDTSRHQKDKPSSKTRSKSKSEQDAPRLDL